MRLRWALLLLVACGSDDPDDLSGTLKRRSSPGQADDDFVSANDDVVVGASGATNAELCVNTINEYRKKKGLPLYTHWTDKDTCSANQAQTDAQSNKPHGQFGKCTEMAQNECPGTPGQADKALPRCLAMMMDEGPGGGHYDSMMSREYTKVSCGVFMTSKGTMWSVQNFR